MLNFVAAMLQIEVLLTENQIAEEFLASLEQRYLAEKFFYWFPLSVKAWLDLCRGAQPYKNFSRSYVLLARHAAEIAGHLRHARVEVVGLGAGQGDKDLLVLEALRANGSALYYRPVDSSQALLELALARAAEAGFSAGGLKADLEKADTAQALAASAREPRLYLLLGNTLGAFDPPQLLGALARLLRPEDRLLVDGEIFSAQDTLAGYDNPVNRQFAFAPLASVGVQEGRDGALIFESGAEDRLEGLHFVSKHFRASRRLEISLGGRRIELAAGESIFMSRSLKYSRPRFLRMISEQGRMRALKEFVSDDERFVTVLAEPAQDGQGGPSPLL